ncbi:MAG: RNA methyltransferase [Flavobacteriaceae bacterium]|nr:RNA methyltransferase [Flavobacteriaceae bacterium]
MLSKNQIKLVNSLKQKKYRFEHQLFIAEGFKTVNELINSSFELQQLYSINTDFGLSDKLVTKITPNDLKKISCLKSPNEVLAVFHIPKHELNAISELTIALDNLRDPGNLGTIIRLCDWYGVSNLICNLETVDCYNPKVVQATMGSIARVNVNYVNLKDWLPAQNTPVLGAFMDGDNVYKHKLPNSGILVLGNEANGIDESLELYIDQRISIPRFGALQATESLNVANAAAVLLSEFRRNLTEK